VFDCVFLDQLVFDCVVLVRWYYSRSNCERIIYGVEKNGSVHF
jgi:hypothetical protein